MLKTIQIIDEIINKIVRIFFIIVLLLGAYFIADSLYVYRAADDGSYLRYRPEAGDVTVMKEISDDVVAWITIDDTSIDYPIMQGASNEEYLNKDPYGSFSLSGSIFLDSRNSADLTDPYSLLYGHHMEHGYMFGCLDSFMDESYFMEHRTGTVTALDGSVYRFTAFAADIAQTNTDEIFAVTEDDGLPEYLKNYADIYVDMEHDGLPILGLSTCKTPDSIDRTCVFGYLDKIEGQTGEVPETVTEVISPTAAETESK